MIVLDTHAWVWWVSGSKSPIRRPRGMIDDAMAAGRIHVSSISAWEVAMLVECGRMELTMDVNDWIGRSESLPFLHFVPVSNAIAVRPHDCPTFPTGIRPTG